MITGAHFYLAIGLPYLTVLGMFLAETFLNRAAVNDLRAEMRAGFVSICSPMRSGAADPSAPLDRIEKRLDMIDTEIRIKHDHRLAILEARLLSREDRKR